MKRKKKTPISHTILPAVTVVHKTEDPIKYTPQKEMTPVSSNSPGPRQAFSNSVGQIGMENIENLLNINSQKQEKKEEITKKSVTNAPAIQKAWNIYSQDEQNTDETT